MEERLVQLLKLKHLRLIAAIAEFGQLSKAAESMPLAQPAASRMLQDIESIVSAPLFERGAKGMALTMLGQAIARHAENILLDLRDLNREVEDIKQGRGGKVGIGAVTGAAVGFVIPAVQKFKSIFPAAEIHLDIRDSHVLTNELMEGKIDFVLARIIKETDTTDLEIQPIYTESVQLVVGEHHPLAAATEVSIEDVAKYEWVIQTSPSPRREALENAFIAGGFQIPPNIISTTSLLAQIAILASPSSLAIAPLTSEVAELLTSKQVGAKFKILPPELSIKSVCYLLQLKGRHLSPLANRLKKLVLDEINEMGKESTKH